MNQREKKILMIFIEPTPYILDLLKYGFLDLRQKYDVIFLSENLTQNWNLESYPDFFEVIKSKKKSLSLLYDIFLRRKYKLIHVAGWGNLFNLLLILMSRFFRLPVVVESDTQLYSSSQGWKKIIKKYFYPVLFKFPAHFLPGGTRQAKYLNYYGVKYHKITKQQMTVNIRHITDYTRNITSDEQEKLRQQYGAQKNDVIFLYVGRLLDWKGIRELISAIQLIQNNQVKLWVVGSGELRNEVECATKKSEKISYLGRVSGDLLWKIYAAADVFILPSHAEPWGLVVNEAMAAGRPVIVSQSVGCVEDLICDQQNGLIIRPKSVPSLCEAMYFMLENAEKRKLMSKNSLEHIASWTLQNEANNMITAWGKVCH